MGIGNLKPVGNKIRMSNYVVIKVERLQPNMVMPADVTQFITPDKWRIICDTVSVINLTCFLFHIRNSGPKQMVHFGHVLVNSLYVCVLLFLAYFVFTQRLIVPLLGKSWKSVCIIVAKHV